MSSSGRGQIPLPVARRSAKVARWAHRVKGERVCGRLQGVGNELVESGRNMARDLFPSAGLKLGLLVRHIYLLQGANSH
jgi:hypothetical protein